MSWTPSPTLFPTLAFRYSLVWSMAHRNYKSSGKLNFSPPYIYHGKNSQVHTDVSIPPPTSLVSEKLTRLSLSETHRWTWTKPPILSITSYTHTHTFSYLLGFGPEMVIKLPSHYLRHSFSPQLNRKLSQITVYLSIQTQSKEQIMEGNLHCSPITTFSQVSKFSLRCPFYLVKRMLTVILCNSRFSLR